MDILELRAAAARLLYNNNRDTADYNALISFIEGVDSKTKKFRWVPVTERLPKNGRKVLLYTTKGEVFRGHYDHVHKCWRTTKTVNITHWRLPDGPDDWREFNAV